MTPPASSDDPLQDHRVRHHCMTHSMYAKESVTYSLRHRRHNVPVGDKESVPSTDEEQVATAARVIAVSLAVIGTVKDTTMGLAVGKSICATVVHQFVRPLPPTDIVEIVGKMSRVNVLSPNSWIVESSREGHHIGLAMHSVAVQLKKKKSHPRRCAQVVGSSLSC